MYCYELQDVQDGSSLIMLGCFFCLLEIRLKNLLREYGVDDYSSMENTDPLSPTVSSTNNGRGEHRRHGTGDDQQEDLVDTG